MKSRAEFSVDPAVLVFWRERFEFLDRKLSGNPSTEQAWFWRIQWDILNYLLHRYAGDELKAPSPAPTDQTQFANMAFDPSPDSSPEIAPAKSFAKTGSGKPPRDSRQIGSVLKKIAVGNYDRYQFLHRLHDEMIETLRHERELGRDWADRVDRAGLLQDLIARIEQEERAYLDMLRENGILDQISRIVLKDEPDQDGKR